jgi:hypothetical protein
VAKYIVCSKSEIPEGVRWDVPGRHQGQIIEIAYGAFGATGFDDGAPYRKVTDQSLDVTDPGRVTYCRRAGIGLATRWVHYTNVASGQHRRPAAADAKGFLSYRDGYDKEVPDDEWTDAERWLHEMGRGVADQRR